MSCAGKFRLAFLRFSHTPSAKKHNRLWPMYFVSSFIYTYFRQPRSVLDPLRADLMIGHIMEISLQQVGVALMFILLLFSGHHRNSRQQMRQGFACGWKIRTEKQLKGQFTRNLWHYISILCSYTSFQYSVYRCLFIQICLVSVVAQCGASAIHTWLPAHPCLSKTRKYYFLNN